MSSEQMSRYLSSLFLFIAGLLLAGSAQAAFPLYAIDGNFDAGSTQTSQLYRIDPNDGSVIEVVGDTGLNLTTFVYSQSSNSFLATTALQSDLPSYLVSIDPFTAISDAVGPITGDPSYIPPANGPYQFLGLEPYLGRENQLLALGLFSDDVTNGENTRVFQIDTVQIMADWNIFYQGPPSGAFAIAASFTETPLQSSVFFGCESLPSVNSYYTRRVFNFTPPIPWLVFPLPDSSCFVDGLRISEGNYLGIQFDPASPAPRSLTRLLIQDEQAVLVELGALLDNTVSIARGPAPPSNVPVLGSQSLILMILLLGLFACWAIRRRRLIAG